MVGGTVIENALGIGQRSGEPRRQLWCVDSNSRSDECAVFCDIEAGKDVRPGDRIWWQERTIYWTRDGEFVEREIPKVGFSFDPRKDGSALVKAQSE
jgi:hypothetical protein